MKTTFTLDLYYTQYLKENKVKKFTRKDFYTFGNRMGYTFRQCEIVWNNPMSFRTN